MTPEQFIDDLRRKGITFTCRFTAMSPPAVVEEVNEKDFMAAVIAIAKRHGWLCYHTHDSRKSIAGFPDLCMVRERVVWAELKVGNNKLTADQLNWVEQLAIAHQEVYVWRPSDWPKILEVLAK